MKNLVLFLMMFFSIILMSLIFFSFKNEKYSFCPNYEFYVHILNDNNNQVNSFLVNDAENTAITNSTTKFWPSYVNSSCSRSSVFKFQKNRTYFISRPNSLNCVCIRFFNDYKINNISALNYDEATKKFSIKSLSIHSDIQIQNKVNKKCDLCPIKLNIDGSKIEKFNDIPRRNNQN